MKSRLLLVSISALILGGCGITDKRFAWKHPDKGWGHTMKPSLRFGSVYLGGSKEFSKDHEKCDSYAWRNAPTRYITIKNNDAVSTTYPETDGWEYRRIFTECMQDKYGWKQEKYLISKPRPKKLPAIHFSGALEGSEQWHSDRRDCDIETAPVKEYGVSRCIFFSGWQEQWEKQQED